MRSVQVKTLPRLAMFKRLIVFGIVFLLMSLSTAHAGKIKAIATISIVGDVVRNVAGDSVDLKVFVGPNGDAHGYEAISEDAVTLSKADILFENNLHLEHWLDKLYDASGSKAKRVVVSSGITPLTMEDHPQETDPHAWQDVANVILYTRNVRDALVALDPANKMKYETNAGVYIEQLKILDKWTQAQVASIPEGQRKLVTNHDALGYFARRYGLKIIGAVIPSATTEAADPSAQQTAQLLNIIKVNNVHAIFSENMANSKLAQILSKEAGVVVGPGLYTDALGEQGSDGDTYVKMLRHNVDVLLKYLK